MQRRIHVWWGDAEGSRAPAPALLCTGAYDSICGIHTRLTCINSISLPVWSCDMSFPRDCSLWLARPWISGLAPGDAAALSMRSGIL